MPIENPTLPPIVQYNLPLLWSLCYALTDKQWKGLRDRHKALVPEWDRCDCPKSCIATSLDERWEYDRANHTKIFLDAKFICSGCHWLKSPTWRILTWRKPPRPTEAIKPSHIIDCLGWTQERVDKLRESDLREDRQQNAAIQHQERQIQEGKAAVVPGPLDRVSRAEMAELAKPGQVLIVPWKVDLSRLTAYNYEPKEIASFEDRMYRLAAKRMTTRGHV